MDTEGTDDAEGVGGVIGAGAGSPGGLVSVAGVVDGVPAEIAALTEEQRSAATCLDRDVLVTAGAGSGKTSTLVARYLWLVQQGFAPRRILAITFTEKAALEMRGRVRAAVGRQVGAVQDPEGRRRWAEAEGQMEAARIGTIHGLCAEILRAHPAEAAVDPGFEVADEARSRLLKAESVEDALAWAPASEAVAPLLDHFGTFALRRVLAYLLDRRLEARAVMDGFSRVPVAPPRSSAVAAASQSGAGTTAMPPPTSPTQAALAHALQGAVSTGPLADAVAELRALRDSGGLVEDAGDKLAGQIEGLLDVLDRMQAALAAGDGVAAAGWLFAARREHMHRGAGKRTSLAKELLTEIQAAYDARVHPWLGGKAAGDTPPDPTTELLFGEDQPRLAALFRQAEAGYRAALAARRALDFDDLEAGAATLLERPEVQARWQAAVDAILVDEFQDTNARQIAIVEALCGPLLQGRLFVVGDARQSIYRFRGADVGAFRRMERDFAAGGALAVQLNRSFRTHAALATALDGLLSRCIEAEEGAQAPPAEILENPGAGDPSPYGKLPYTPLVANRADARAGIRPPFVELVLGAGADAGAARPVAAGALADRLLALRAAGEIRVWDEVALLFRASSGYAAYEAAFEDRGIPFVTVAGGGFYDRPEVRDILNILRALAEPWNDLALAGLLRSPAFGLSDAALIQLRWDAEHRAKRRLRTALAEPAVLAGLGERDRAQALRAAALIDALAPRIDRLPVAEVLKQVVDRLDYRAVLATGGSRLWRNLDKLLADARASRLVRVRAFLAYVEALRDVGAREGEAATEGAGAVQLMTIHKAKGLEFPITVLADAAHARTGGGALVHLDPQIGPAFQPDRFEHTPLAWRLSRVRDAAAEAAESGRLLYVAATRACEKLLVSGHLTGDPDKGWQSRGWLKTILDATCLDYAAACTAPGELFVYPLEGAAGTVPIGLLALTGDTLAVGPSVGIAPPTPSRPVSTRDPLWGPPRTASVDRGGTEPVEAASDDSDTGDEPPPRLGRVTGARYAPGKSVGDLVHRAIERWCFPGDPRLDRLWAAETARLGLVDGAERDDAIQRATDLLNRLHAHPLWEEIDTADERRHELPYVARARRGDRVDSRRVDLLYRRGGAWTLIDFKTDAIGDAAELDRLSESAAGKPDYPAQVRRYAAAIRELAGIAPAAKLCFLDCAGAVRVVVVDTSGDA